MKLSKEKRDKICEQILFYLFTENPKPIFTAHIAKEIARDEEFVKSLLKELKEKKLVIEIHKNKEGINYLRRSRWKLANETYNYYNIQQQNKF
jgi:predicted transcriptional regulator with HTH domain